MPSGNGVGIRWFSSDSQDTQPAPLPLTNVVLEAGPYYGRIPLTVTTANDPNLFGVRVYLAPTGVALNKPLHADRFFRVEPNSVTSFIYGEQGIVENFLAGKNADFGSPGPPPKSGPWVNGINQSRRNWSISGGKAVFTQWFHNAMTSPDGLDWTTQSVPFGNVWNGICWSAPLGLFCIVASTGTVNDRIMTSPDGITWTARTVPELINFQDVCWGGTCFVAVGNGGGTTSRAVRSTDGITWSVVGGSTFLSRTFFNICYSPDINMFCATANSGTSRVATSPDGITWTLRTVTNPSVSWGDVVWAGPPINKFVTICSTAVITSPDGVTWSGLNTLPSQAGWNGLTWSPDLGMLCSVSQNLSLNRVVTSTDAVNWTLSALPAPDLTINSWYDVVWVPPPIGKFVAVGLSAGGGAEYPRVMTSPDGIAWTFVLPSPTVVACNFKSVCWSPELEKLVTVADNNLQMSETLYWDFSVAKGERCRAAYTIESVNAGAVIGPGFAWINSQNQPYSEGIAGLIWALSQSIIPGRKLINTINNTNPQTSQIGLFGSTSVTDMGNHGGTTIIDDIVLFKQTPDMPAQGFYDIYVFPVNDSQIEGPGFAPFINVEVV